MKNLFSFLALFCVLFVATAQTKKITFEDNGLNSAAAMYGGTVSTVTNPYTTGINASNYCLDVLSTSYAPIKLGTMLLPSGAAASYSYVTLNVKFCYVDGNGGTDVDYPQLEIHSSPSAGTLDATTKLQTVNNVWYSGASNVGVWKQVSFTFSASLLSTIPDGTLVLKIGKQKLHYLIDDIELVASQTATNSMFSVNNFENNTIGDAISYVLAWSNTTAASGTSVVAADPALTSTKSLRITPTDYNGVAMFNVTLPTGKTIADYDRVYFDVYPVAALNAQLLVKSDANVIYQDASGYPSQGTVGSWNSKYVPISGITSSNSFILKIGYTSNNSVQYYLDNIALRIKELTTKVSNVDAVSPLVYSVEGTSIKFNKVVDNVEIFDYSGRLVVSQRNTSVISGIKSGVYIVKSSVEGQLYTSKLVCR